MNPLVPKIIGSVATISALGTGTYFGAKELLRAETLREKLTKSAFKFIEAGDTAQWDLEFGSDKVSIAKELGSNVKDGVTLETKCKEMLDSSNNKDLEKAKKWCGIRSFTDQLSRSKKAFLVNDTSANVAEKWTATYQKRKSVQATRDKLGLNGAWPSSEVEDLEKVKTWCGQKKDLDYSVANVETYKVIEAWCTEEGAKAEFK